VRAILLTLCLATTALPTPPSSALGGEHIPAMAPDFTRRDLGGTPLTLSGYRGKLVLLNFWATWCGPCLAEIPEFAAWQTRYAEAGLQIVGVAMDDSPAPVRRVAGKYHLNYPLVMGDAQLGERFGGVLGLPLTYLIDPQGRIVGRYQGDADLKRLEAQIRTLLRGLGHAPLGLGGG